MKLDPIADNLRQIVKDSKYVPHDIAAETNKHIQTVWNYQNGRGTPTLMGVIELSELLEVYPSNLLEGCYEIGDAYSPVLLYDALKSCSDPIRIENSEKVMDYFIRFNVNPWSSTFGQKVKVIRQSFGYDRVEFGNLIDLAESTIIKFESSSDAPLPYITNVLTICEVLHVSPDYLLSHLIDRPKDKLKQKVSCLLPLQIELVNSLLY